MQSLFAFHQNKEATYQLCYDYVGLAFGVDLNSMEVQDKTELSRQQKEALTLFSDSFKKSKSPTHDDDKIVEVVKKNLDLYSSLVKKDLVLLSKSLVRDVENIYTHYLSVLMLAASFAEAAASDKKINHNNFIDNLWIRALCENAALKSEASKRNTTWNNQTDRVRTWLRDVVKKDDEYMAYLDKSSPTPEDQKKFINYFFRKIILGKTIINEYFEEGIIHWAEDQEIVKGMVEKTIKSYKPGNDQVLQLHTLSLNWEDDLEFINQLFKGAAQLEPNYQKLIADNTRNWEVDRLPLTDRAILEMAIVELIGFPSIPIKVTINEYIELAKTYSTPKSRQFINGILDVISKELKSSGSLKKSGRGLMDNK